MGLRARLAEPVSKVPKPSGRGQVFPVNARKGWCEVQLGLAAMARSGEHCPGWVALPWFHGLGQDPAAALVARARHCCPQ